MVLVEGLGLLEGNSAGFPDGWMDGGASGKVEELSGFQKSMTIACSATA